jgi:peptidoglycan/xylan/chitin deacetylase (PgdA/CDA1 family)
MAEFSAIPPVGEVREPGMDHALYPFRTLPEAPRFAWPGGNGIAFTVTLVLDYWEVAPPENASTDPRPLSPLGGGYFPDWVTWSMREYGNRVGIFRVLDRLDRFGVKSGVALGAEVARRCPELVDECARRGAVFLGHGTHATRRITSRMSEQQERDFIAQSREAVRAATGQAPAGWCGQDFNESPDTPRLLAEAGFSYVTDWSNDDRPYLIGPGGLVSLPAHSEWNDLETMWLRHMAPDVWARSVAEGFDVLHAEGGAVFNLTLHPFVSGQPHRIRYLEQTLASVLGKSGVWRATSDDVAAAARPVLELQQQEKG